MVSKSLLIVIVVVLILIVGIGLYVVSTNNSTSSNNLETEDTVLQVSDVDNINNQDNPDGEAIPITDDVDVTFVLTGQNFKFMMNGDDNPTLRVKQGDKVRIEFTSSSGFHDWVLDEFDAATSQVSDTQGMTSVEFIADQKGSYEYYCSVGEHRANGMEGMFIVE